MEPRGVGVINTDPFDVFDLFSLDALMWSVRRSPPMGGDGGLLNPSSDSHHGMESIIWASWSLVPWRFAGGLSSFESLSLEDGDMH